MRRSIKLRKEKSLFLRIYCELNDIRLNRGNSILAKKIFYLNFYNSKTYKRLLRFMKWA
jgi:hypothetical protein